MRKTFYITLTTYLLSTFVFTGCGVSSGYTTTSDVQIPQTNEKSYQDVQFSKLIQPAFVKDYAGKYVRFEAVFNSVFSTTIDLPSEYKEFIRIILRSPSGDAASQNIVVSKEIGDKFFSMYKGQEIKVSAYAQEVKRRLIAGGQEGSLLLVIDSFIEHTEEKSEKQTSTTNLDTLILLKYAGKYIRKNISDDFIRLEPDGTFKARQRRGKATGNWEINGEKLILKLRDGKSSLCKLKNGTIIDDEDLEWIKE